MARRPEPTRHPLSPRQSGWLLATGLAAFAPLTPHVPLWLAALAGTVFAWRALLSMRQRPLPPQWLLIVISLTGAAAVLVHYRTLFGQQAGVALLLLFLAFKQLEARSTRDGLAIILLAYFLTLTQFFQNQSIPVAFSMAATLVIATAALASLTDAEARPVALVRLAGLMLAQALPFMLILFVLFPRVPGPLWGLPTDAYSGLTGLSDRMSPGAINNLIQSDAIAFRVKFDGPPPERTALYWRGPVLTHLDGRTWYPGNPATASDLPYRPLATGPAYHYSVTLEPHNKPWLFALELPARIPPQAFATTDFQLHAQKPVRERIRYELHSQPVVQYFPENLDTLAAALSLPDISNPRTRKLGERWQAEGGSDSQRVQRAIDFMRNQRLTYTLQPPLMSTHVADEFLFDQQRGFCEHFSAAFVVLVRAAGVPARVVTGYQGGEHNPIDDTWVIRQSDAHAWTEVWLEQHGWVRVDPTAVSMPARIEQNLAAAVPVGERLPWMSRQQLEWLRDLRYRWWAVNNAWNQWVLGYNTQRQLDFLKKLGMPSPDWRKMTLALAMLCGSLLLALIGAMLWRRPHPDPVERQWRKLSRRLGKRGLARHPWEGPHDYARRVGQAQPLIAMEIDRIATLYAGLRYGKLPPHQIDTLRRQVAAIQP